MFVTPIVQHLTHTKLTGNSVVVSNEMQRLFPSFLPKCTKRLTNEWKDHWLSELKMSYRFRLASSDIKNLQLCLHAWQFRNFPIKHYPVLKFRNFHMSCTQKYFYMHLTTQSMMGIYEVKRTKIFSKCVRSDDVENSSFSDCDLRKILLVSSMVFIY